MGNLTDHFSAGGGNNIIEEISGVCNGMEVTTDSGTYTLPNVTAIQALTTSYVDCGGSYFTYTPPSDATYVRYSYKFKLEQISGGGISHFKLMVDGSEVVDAYRGYSFSSGSAYGDNLCEVQWWFKTNATTEDISAGQFTSWTSDKVIKVQGREYSGSHTGQINSNHYRNGAGATGDYEIARPFLTIQSFK